jgi:hypothetical protein
VQTFALIGTVATEYSRGSTPENHVFRIRLFSHHRKADCRSPVGIVEFGHPGGLNSITVRRTPMGFAEVLLYRNYTWKPVLNDTLYIRWDSQSRRRHDK